MAHLDNPVWTWATPAAAAILLALKLTHIVPGEAPIVVSLAAIMLGAVVFAAVMIVLSGVVGLCLLLGGRLSWRAELPASGDHPPRDLHHLPAELDGPVRRSVP